MKKKPKQESTLERVAKIPLDELHLDEIDPNELTQEEAKQGFKELVEKYKNQKVVNQNPPDFGKATVDALNSITTDTERK